MSTATAATQRSSWLDWRRKGIGSSDMAAILGVSPFKTALDVYLDKIGEAPDEPATLQQRIGLALEPGVLKLYAEETGREVVDTQMGVMHDQHAFLRATLDAVMSDGKDHRVVEAKTVGGQRAGELGDEGSDQVPEHWLTQVHHQMLCVGDDCEVVDIAALVRGTEFRIFTVERDAEFVRLIVDAGREFWARVQERRPPEPSLPADARHLPRIFGAGQGECELDPVTAEIVAGYEELGRDVERLRLHEAARKRMAAEIVAALGEHASGTLPDGRVVRRKHVSVAERTQTVKGYEFYRLSIK